MTMTTTETKEHEIILLCKNNILGDRYSEDGLSLPGSFRLCEYTRGYDESRTYLYPATKKATVTFYDVDFHNGTHYNHTTIYVPWEQAIEAVYPTIKEIAQGFIEQQERRAAEEAAKLARDKKYTSFLEKLERVGNV